MPTPSLVRSVCSHQVDASSQSTRIYQDHGSTHLLEQAGSTQLLNCHEPIIHYSRIWHHLAVGLSAQRRCLLCLVHIRLDRAAERSGCCRRLRSSIYWRASRDWDRSVARLGAVGGRTSVLMSRSTKSSLRYSLAVNYTFLANRLARMRRQWFSGSTRHRWKASICHPIF